MTRSSTSVLATSRAACFAYVLDNTVIVSLLCSRPPQFHAFVLSTLFQARYVGHHHASDCFLVWLPVLVLHFLPFCIISTMFCFPWWASPTERVCVFVRFIAFAVVCCGTFFCACACWHLAAVTLPFAPVAFSLMCGNCFDIFLCCSCASWDVGLDWSACTRVPMSWQGDSRDTYIVLWHHEWWLDPLQRLGKSPQVVSATARTAASATPVTAQLLFAIRARHVVVFSHVLLGMAVTFVIHLVTRASHVIHGSDQLFLPRHSQDNNTSLCHDAGCFSYRCLSMA